MAPAGQGRQQTRNGGLVDLVPGELFGVSLSRCCPVGCKQVGAVPRRREWGSGPRGDRRADRERQGQGESPRRRRIHTSLRVKPDTSTTSSGLMAAIERPVERDWLNQPRRDKVCAFRLLGSDRVETPEIKFVARPPTGRPGNRNLDKVQFCPTGGSQLPS